jgi:rhamnosyltransferase subunit B
MSRIILTTFGSLGDLHPKIALALELQARGHDVVLATHQSYQAKVQALGLNFWPIRPDIVMDDPVEMAKAMDRKTGTEYVIRWIYSNLRDTYADLYEITKGADLLIAAEGVASARLVAETLNVPWASVVLQPVAFLSRYDQPVLPLSGFETLVKLPGFDSLLPWLIPKLAKWVTRSWTEPMVELRQELGLPPLKGNFLIDNKYSPHCVLALFSSHFAKAQPDWPQQVTQTGFAYYDASDTTPKTELQQFLAAGEPPLVFTLGSAAVMAPGQFFAESIAATLQLNRRAILLMGKNPPLPGLPKNILALDYAPYSQVFPHASVIVHQGGIGTTAQGLRAGRPTLIMPYSHDQPDNASRAERLGTSRTIAQSQYRVKRLVPILQDLLDDSTYATKAQAIAAALQAEDGIGQACNVIESYLHSIGL